MDRLVEFLQIEDALPGSKESAGHETSAPALIKAMRDGKKSKGESLSRLIYVHL